MADGFGYVSRPGRSTAQEAHVQARLAQLAAMRKRDKQLQRSPDYSLPPPGSSGTTVSAAAAGALGHQQQHQRPRTGTGYSCDTVRSTRTGSSITSAGTSTSITTSTSSDWTSRFLSAISPTTTSTTATNVDIKLEDPYDGNNDNDTTEQQYRETSSRDGRSVENNHINNTMMDPNSLSQYYHARSGNTPHSSAASFVSSSHSEVNHDLLLKDPYELRDGRRYLREVPYPLPCDLAELQRQNLRTLLACKVFGGRAICSPNFDMAPPARVLEIGCGSGFWSAMCHDQLAHIWGDSVADRIEFTGLDVAPLAPDLARTGLDWRFVQHDLRRLPLPFDDGEFDFIMLKDVGVALPLGGPYERFLAECMRCLEDGGTIEVWDSDAVVRSLQPHPPAAPVHDHLERETAELNATYCVTPTTPFAAAENKFLRQSNKWIADALDRRRLPVQPSRHMARLLSRDPALRALGSRRIAIPLGGELPWERDAAAISPTTTSSRSNSNVGMPPSAMNTNNAIHDSPMSSTSSSRTHKGRLVATHRLTEDQTALRQTALITVTQMIEGMEPFLRESSGKNTEEWGNWWASMMANLTDPSRSPPGAPALSGECLELNAWWVTKRP